MSTNFWTRFKSLFFKTSLTVRPTRLLLTISLILVGLVSQVTLKASHIIGGEIRYEFVGFKNGRVGSDTLLYRIILTLIRDCSSGTALDRSVPITIYQGNNKTPFLNLVFSNPKFTRTPADMSNPCLTIPPGYCEEEGLYVDTVALLKSNQAYTITHQVCCRTTVISNIPNRDETLGNTFTIEISPQAQNYLSSNPAFTAIPRSELCANIPATIPLQVADKDGDRLTYHLCAPLKGGGPFGGRQGDPNTAKLPNGIKPDPATPAPYEELPFSPSFSFLKPFGSTGSLSLDSTTGIMQVYPRALGHYTVGVCVKEYRSGELIGMIRRDLQLKVSNCTFAIDAAVKADSSNGQGDFWLEFCKPTFTFSNTSTGQDKIMGYRWEFNINGRTEVRDTKDASFDFGAPGTYQGVMVLNPGTVCTDTAHIFVEISPSVKAQFTAMQEGCERAPIQFTNTSQLNEGATFSSIRWDFGDNNKSSDSSPQHNYAFAGSYLVGLHIVTNTGCRDSVKQLVDYYPLPADSISMEVNFREACARSIPIRALVNQPNVMSAGNYIYEWDWGDGTRTIGFMTPRVYDKPGTYLISYRISARKGTCTAEGTFDDIPITILEKPQADFSFSPEEITARDPEVNFLENSIGGDNWTWDFGGKGSSNERNPVFTFPFGGEFPVTLVVGNGLSCRDSITKIVKIKSVDAFYMPTAFSPNGNSANAVFKPLGLLPGISNYEFRIYARWGQLIFKTQNPDEAWNGKTNNQGKDCEQGVYFYQVLFQSAAGKTITKEGTVMLLR